MRISIKTRLFFSHFVAVVLVSGSIGTYFYLSAMDSLMENLKSRLSSTAAMAAESVKESMEIRNLDALQRAADVHSLMYAKSLAVLRRLQKANPDIAYLYIMRRDGAKTVFVLDSDESGGQALPGTEYPNPPAPLLAGFYGSSVDDRLYEDAWGVFMSGYSPLQGAASPLLLGIDMRDAEVSRKLRRLRLSGLISLILSLGLAFIFSAVLARRINRPLQLFIQTCSAIADGKPEVHVDVHTGDELDRLAGALNLMSSRLASNQSRRAQVEAELVRSRDEMESKVRERTAELQELNQRLVFEIEERKRVEEALLQAAMTDSLTGLPNRRAMEKQLSAHLARVKRGGQPFAVLLCDVDRFKSVNDAYGHEAGDQMLRAFAGILQSSVRTGDMVSRWGGEEFLILLAETGLEGGRAAGENLRQSFAGHVMKIKDADICRTISIGVATSFGCRDEDDVVRRADEALYEAKRLGRNLVVVASQTNILPSPV